MKIIACKASATTSKRNSNVTQKVIISEKCRHPSRVRARTTILKYLLHYRLLIVIYYIIKLTLWRRKLKLLYCNVYLDGQAKLKSVLKVRKSVFGEVYSVHTSANMIIWRARFREHMLETFSLYGTLGSSVTMINNFLMAYVTMALVKIFMLKYS